MEEHQNNTDTHVQDDSSGDGTAKVIKAGSEAKPGRRVLRGGGAGNNGNQADGSDQGITEAAPAEAARRVVRAGQQALEDAEAVTHAAVDAVDESTGGGRVLDEWASFVRRASLRNTQAVGELMHCYTFSSLLQWQTNLLSANVTDLWGTNARILRLVTHKA